MQYAIPKGVFDILPVEPKAEDGWRVSDRWHYVEEVMRAVAQMYGFREIRTPIFERTELFVRGVGESSDIVTKEMYTFLDKAERSMTLRPEGTASVMRAFLEKNLHNTTPPPYKYFYIGPMFRYERPQAGRYRQHHQFGAEAIGHANPEQDVECIDMLCTLYRLLGLKNLSVQLNSVGDAQCRAPFQKALQDYLLPYFDQLSKESQERFSKNVLRIFDSKDPKDQEILVDAPRTLDMLNEECREHFAKVCSLLEGLKIPYQLTPKLVRGLDYYNKTVFEIASGQLGAQNAIGGGGRYDGLTEALGGPKLPAVGFATGIERVLQTMEKQGAHFPAAAHPKFFLIGLGDEARNICFSLLHQLRQSGISAEMEMDAKKLGQGLQVASALRATYAVIIGDQELQTKTAQIKNMSTRSADSVPFTNLLDHLLDLK